MRRRSRIHLIGTSLIVCLATTTVVTQSEKINVRFSPKPGQMVRHTMTQEMDIDITLEGATASSAGPMKMSTKTTMTMTQTIGALKPDGTMEAEIHYDQIKAEMLMNGQSTPTNALDQLTGKTITVKYNRNGEVVDMTGLPENGLPPDAFKQMMSAFYVNLPMEPLAVGEAFSTPLNLAIPLPLGGGSPVSMSGEMRTTLVSVDRGASGRSATLDAVVAAAMIGDIPSPDGKSTMRLDFSLSGTGTNVMDLETGMLRSSTSTNVVRGRMDAAGAARMPPMRMELTTRITITTN